MPWVNPYTPPPGMAEASFNAWWSENFPKMQAERTAYYKTSFTDPIAALQGKWPTYTKQVWEGSPWQTEYQEQKTGLDALIARMQTGATEADTAEARARSAQMYGYTPEQWEQMQAGILTPEQAYLKSKEIAGQQTPYDLEQEKRMRVQERAAAEQIGKQIEVIMGEHGTSAAFAAAYEMTFEMTNQFAQQRMQMADADLERAWAAVNDQNEYYRGLLDKGALLTQDYLKLRFSELSKAMDSYAIGVAEALDSYATLEAVDRGQYETEINGLSKQIDLLNQQMAIEMGYDTDQIQLMKDTYELYVEPVKAKEELETPAPALSKETLTLAGAGLLSAGAFIAGTAITAGLAIPVLGWFLLVTGGFFWLIGALMPEPA